MQVLFGGGLAAEQLHGAVRRCSHYGDHHDVAADISGSSDEVGVAVTVNRPGRHSTWSREAVDGGHDGVDAGEGRGKRAGLADVAFHNICDDAGELLSPLAVAGQHPHLGALRGETFNYK